MNAANQDPGDPNARAAPAAHGKQPPDHDGNTISYQEPASAASDTVASRPRSAQPKPPPAALPDELPASIGRYLVRSRLGGGGFGVVYLGYDAQLDRQVAIKVPKLNARLDPRERAEDLFLAEARQVAKLSHPGIVAVFEVGIDNDRCFIVADYLDGPDLTRWVADHAPTWQEAVQIVASIADALAAAHARGIVHRDVKAANVIMTERAEGWQPMLVDFGLALSDVNATSLGGQRGVIAGTPSYMSPEQARGEGHRIDGRTDIYSLGVILYRMLCGRVPFAAPSSMALLQMVIQDEPRPPRQFVHNLPRELERICLKAMAKNLGERYTTAGDLAHELRNLLRQQETEIEAARLAAAPKPRLKSRDGMKILIAEDHELTRFKLQTDLEKWGHVVVAAQDGAEAWELFQKEEFTLVITDWMMPHVDGLELVQRIRAAERPNYVYIIMLTSKAEKHDIVSGMGAGADDFLAKPVHRDELQVRLRAGARITKLNRELGESNQRLKNGLEAAAQLQRSFLPTTKPCIAGFEFAWDSRPSARLGGDMFHVVAIDRENVGMYVLDVAGEGVAAALLATNLSRILSSAFDPASILVDRSAGAATHQVLEPAEVAKRLNQRFSHQTSGQYFTLAYGILHLPSRAFRFTSAGHPPLLHQRAGGSPRMLDLSGYPVGMAPENEPFQQSAVQLETGDRLLMYSDGLPDVMNADGEVFGAARLIESVARLASRSVDAMVRTLLSEVDQWRGDSEINDDVTILAIETSSLAAVRDER